jgi:AcrR family transcriptional regulator
VPRVSPAYRLTQQEAILDAAEACFAREGVADTRVDDIVAEAGMSVGAIYRYFPSKDDIIFAVGERYRRRDLAAMARLQAQYLPLRERILQGLRFFLARPADRVALETLALSGAGRDRETFDAWLQWVSERYAEAQAQGLVRADIPVSHIARQLILTYEGVAVLLASGTLEDAEAVLESLATVLADGLAPRPVAAFPIDASLLEA